MPDESTMPGTLTKVTPEMLAPTMPKATMYQGERRSARKKASLESRRAVRLLMVNSTKKYKSMVRMINMGAKVVKIIES